MNKQSLQHKSPGVTPGAWRKGHKYPSFPRHSFFSSLTLKEKSSSGIAQPPDKKKKRRRRRKGRGGEGKGKGKGKGEGKRKEEKKEREKREKKRKRRE